MQEGAAHGQQDAILRGSRRVGQGDRWACRGQGVALTSIVLGPGLPDGGAVNAGP